MTDPVRDEVRRRYGAAALQVLEGAPTSCCTGAIAGADPITRDLYEAEQAAAVPAAAVQASLGCGNPTALAALRKGEVVLDLGSGGGIDVLLSARRVGPTGRAYGLDMTDEMLALARRNAAEAGIANVEFLQGHIEAIPLPDASVDVIISNCVINLSADKPAVLREAFRVLRPGGRLAVSDVMTDGAIPEAVRRSMELWVGCIAGAPDRGQYLAWTEAAGFVGATVERTRTYRAADAADFLGAVGLDVATVAREVDGRIFSGFLRARKPVAGARPHLRAALPSDRPQVVALLGAHGLPEAGLAADLAGFRIGELDGTVVAAAGLERHGDAALLRSVVAAPVARGTGVAAALVTMVLADAAAAGLTDVWLLTTSADRWFPRFGFEVADRAAAPVALRESAEFAGACPASAVAMRLRLR